MRVSDGDTIPSSRNTSAVGDLIVLQPVPCLDPHTTYRFEVTSGLQDEDGASFTPFSGSFTTGSSGCGAPPGVAFPPHFAADRHHA